MHFTIDIRNHVFWNQVARSGMELRCKVVGILTRMRDGEGNNGGGRMLFLIQLCIE